MISDTARLVVRRIQRPTAGDARVPDLKASVGEILGRPGEYREIHVSAPFGGVETSLARVETAPIRLDGRAESVVEGVLVTGALIGDATLTCARCLTTFSGSVDVELVELFATPGHEGGEAEESYPVTGDEIDLEPMIRDALTLALPLRPLCREDCKGICATCGQDLNAADCNCTQDDTDPRWASLSALREKLEAEG